MSPATDSPCPPRATLAAKLTTLGAVLIPIAGLACGIVLLWQVPFHWTYMAILGGMYLLTMLGVGVGYHRLFTHKSFETSPVMRFILAVLGTMAVEGGVFKWVGLHRMHHQHTDVAGDPHSPHSSPHCDDDDHRGILGVLAGFWYAHIGWFFDRDPPDLARYIPDLMNDKVVSFVDRTSTLWVIMSLVIPAALGGLLTGTLAGILLGFLWGGLARILLVHHVTWSINSVCHLWGSRPFRTGDESRDNPILGILAFGEGWHNTHHAFPTSARHGLSWWKLDINYLVIRAMELLHLVRNVRRPTAERITERTRPRTIRASPPPPATSH